MIRDSRAFFIGILMMVTFVGIYAYMMSPAFGDGRNGLEFADDMFNSISKGSVQNVIQGQIKEVEQWNGTTLDMTINAKDAAKAGVWSQQIQLVEGAEVNVLEDKVAFKVDMGKLLTTISQDCTNMFDNNGDVIKQKYSTDPREVTYNWYNITKAMCKELEKQQNFKESIFLSQYQKKVMEPAYNYYGVESKQVADNKGMMTFMMVFYLFYTIWYGFSIYFMCQGLGITMSKSAKKQEA